MLLYCGAGEDCHEFPWLQGDQLVNFKGNPSWVFMGRTDAEAEVPILWPPNAKNWLIRKNPDAGKDWGQEAKGTTEDKMVGWHRRLNGHEFEQAPGDGDGQGSLECCSPWGHKQSDTTEWLNNNNNIKEVWKSDGGDGENYQCVDARLTSMLSHDQLNANSRES